MQAAVFLTRNAAHAARVLDAGERFPLAVPGNHSKGTMFLDGEHLRTDALERRIDEVARCFPGFYIGRFDIRYRDEAAFRAGRDLAVIELNGATAEPTDLYDPSHSLWSATGSSARSGRWCSRSAPPIDAWAHTRHRSGG
jgi:hypothetical protein